MFKKKFILLALLFVSLAGSNAMADVCTPGDSDYNCEDCEAATGIPGNCGGGGAPVPIDGGASLLAAACGAYGLKKLRDMRKKNASESQSEEV